MHAGSIHFLANFLTWITLRERGTGGKWCPFPGTMALVQISLPPQLLFRSIWQILETLAKIFNFSSVFILKCLMHSLSYLQTTLTHLLQWMLTGLWDLWRSLHRIWIPAHSSWWKHIRILWRTGLHKSLFPCEVENAPQSVGFLFRSTLFFYYPKSISQNTHHLRLYQKKSPEPSDFSLLSSSPFKYISCLLAEAIPRYSTFTCILES